MLPFQAFLRINRTPRNGIKTAKQDNISEAYLNKKIGAALYTATHGPEVDKFRGLLLSMLHLDFSTLLFCFFAVLLKASFFFFFSEITITLTNK